MDVALTDADLHRRAEPLDHLPRVLAERRPLLGLLGLVEVIGGLEHHLGDAIKRRVCILESLCCSGGDQLLQVRDGRRLQGVLVPVVLFERLFILRVRC
jgi:hypothetical protein